MSASTIVTIDYIFQDNTTYLNQENWQGFFGSSLPDGFIGHPAVCPENSNICYVQPKAFLNGLQVLPDEQVGLPAITQSEVNAIYCLIYEYGLIQLKKYTNVSASVSDAVSELRNILIHFAGSLSEVESYLRTKLSLGNHVIPLPVAYEIYGSGVYDLGRALHQNNEEIYAEYTESALATEVATPFCGNLFQSGLAQIYGGHRYDITLPSGYPLSEYHLYPVPALSMDPATIYIANQTSGAVTIKLPLSYRDMYFDYMTDGTWTEDSGYMTYSLTAGSTIAITSKQVLQKTYQSGGVNYPKSVYTISQFVKSA